MTRGPTILVARVRSLAVGGALLVGSLAGLFPAPAAAGSSSTWHVQAGNIDSFTAPSQEHTTYYPASTVVHENDQLVFTGVGQHTVTFNMPRLPGVPTFAYGDPSFFGGDTLNPANQDGGAPLNSGGFGCFGPCGPLDSPSFTLHIGGGTAGSQGTTYHFLCAFHRDMYGTVTVLPSSAKLPSTDAKNQKLAQRLEHADITSATQLAKRTAKAGKKREGVAAGVGQLSVQGLGAVGILRFLPGTLEIEAGQSVTFLNEDINVPHTVTFGEEPADPIPPSGGNVVGSPDTAANSGFLISQELIDYLNVASLIPPGFVVTRSVTYTFPNPGTYHYICALHDELGMVGTVVVRSE
jgi:plastocyanin